MRIGSVVGLAWRYVTGTWVLPGAALVIAALAVRDAIVPEVPLWVGFVEFPLFLFAVFGPFVDAALREDRWHAGRGWIWNAHGGPARGWWSAQFGFLARQLKRPSWWAPVALKLVILLTVSRVLPSSVPYVALLPTGIAALAVTSILATGWAAQPRWDRFAPGGDLPRWAQRRVDRWPLTSAAAGLLLASVSGVMGFYFFAGGNWPVELLCSVQSFWVAVTSTRLLAPDAPWRRSQLLTRLTEGQPSRAA
jgi:hypothetical protein